jgi:hypothetical protein
MMGSGGRMKICQRRRYFRRSRDHFVSQQEERGYSAAIGVTGAKKGWVEGGGDKINTPNVVGYYYYFFLAFLGWRKGGGSFASLSLDHRVTKVTLWYLQ